MQLVLVLYLIGWKVRQNQRKPKQSRKLLPHSIQKCFNLPVKRPQIEKEAEPFRRNRNFQLLKQFFRYYPGYFLVSVNLKWVFLLQVLLTWANQKAAKSQSLIGSSGSSRSSSLSSGSTGSCSSSSSSGGGWRLVTRASASCCGSGSAVGGGKSSRRSSEERTTSTLMKPSSLFT